MNYELKELNMDMARLEYEMFQDIPSKELGSTNLCKGLPYEVFNSYLESQLARKYQNISDYDTKTIVYIMYVNNYPVGYIGLRTELNEKWLNWCGNIYYAIRPKERNKGYATKMLELVLQECKKSGLKEVYINSSFGNIGSAKVIENNGGILIREEKTRYYKIELKKEL